MHSLSFTFSVAGAEDRTPLECLDSSGSCGNKGEALTFKHIAIGLNPDHQHVGDLSAPVLVFNSCSEAGEEAVHGGESVHVGGDTGDGVHALMHVLPDSFQYLNWPFLQEAPWQKFPFATVVAMLSVVATLMVDAHSVSILPEAFSSGP